MIEFAIVVEAVENSTEHIVQVAEVSPASTPIERTSNVTPQVVDYSTKVDVPKPVSKEESTKTYSGVSGTALSMAGSPYVYGGKSPSGWDCSGFVSWVYAQHGINIPSSTSAIRAAGNTVPVSNPRPGDIIFQGGGTHVGIYVGDGQMISARNPAQGTTVHPTHWNGGISGVYRVVG